VSVARVLDPVVDGIDVDRVNADLDGAPAEMVVGWAVETFGDGVVVTTSMTDAVLIDVATRAAPGIEVVFVDTGYHFPETLATLEEVERRYDLRLNVVSAGLVPDGRWRPDPDGCCAVRKVAPLEEVLVQRRAWMTGLRRSESPSRRATPTVELDHRGLVKVNPLAAWTEGDLAAYIAAHDVPVNPLVAAGYPSIGCWPCTRPVPAGADARAGRWAGSGKTECGLHQRPGSIGPTRAG
jgi:phosphoadenosine phosphosulfate reductase